MNMDQEKRPSLFRTQLDQHMATSRSKPGGRGSSFAFPQKPTQTTSVFPTQKSTTSVFPPTQKPTQASVFPSTPRSTKSISTPTRSTPATSVFPPTQKPTQGSVFPKTQKSSQSPIFPQKPTTGTPPSTRRRSNFIDVDRQGSTVFGSFGNEDSYQEARQTRAQDRRAALDVVENQKAKKRGRDERPQARGQTGFQRQEQTRTIQRGGAKGRGTSKYRDEEAFGDKVIFSQFFFEVLGS
jgi:hypothetical protein